MKSQCTHLACWPRLPLPHVFSRASCTPFESSCLRQASRQIIAGPTRTLAGVKTPLPHVGQPLGENEVSDVMDTGRATPGSGTRTASTCLSPSLRTTDEDGQQRWATHCVMACKRGAAREATVSATPRFWDPCENHRLQPNNWNSYHGLNGKTPVQEVPKIRSTIQTFLCR